MRAVWLRTAYPLCLPWINCLTSQLSEYRGGGGGVRVHGVSLWRVEGVWSGGGHGVSLWRGEGVWRGGGHGEREPMEYRVNE